jgi:OmpA-OmpF porin, OOP family
VILNNLFFDFDSADLKPESFTELDKVLAFLKENPSLVVEISGHTDNMGSRQYNLALSERRAQSIVAYLSRSIPVVRLKSKGFGPDFPIAENDSEEGRSKNRRSEMKILEK